MRNPIVHPACFVLLVSIAICFVDAAVVPCAAGDGNAEAAPRATTEALTRLEPLVVPTDERERIARTVLDDVRRRREVLQARHETDWARVKSRADWERFRDVRLAKLKESLGTFPAPAGPPRVFVAAQLPGDGFVIENLLFESRPGVWVAANLYRPDQPAASMPGFVICHAHHTPKTHGELQDMGMTWARAGCVVLVPDQFGHGERRLHPFDGEFSYEKSFRPSRQDYYFRYDLGMQLHVLGDGLVGWMAYDLRRCVDLLLARPGIDPERLLLLGSVAGGGDPVAVTGALEPRYAAVVPFNFGGPSPFPKYPFAPQDEPQWNYAGGGSWESTRNLRNGARDGFVPWVLVAATAPRHLVYAHEFGWFREGDPVWKRLQSAFAKYDAGDRLAFTFGRGDVTKRPPQGTHCTHIGTLHRKMMHEAFARWFRIPLDADREYSQRVETPVLKCWTPAARTALAPTRTLDVLKRIADERTVAARVALAALPLPERRRHVAAAWEKRLGPVAPAEKVVPRAFPAPAGDDVSGATVERILLATEPGIDVPLLLLKAERAASTDGRTARAPTIVLFAQAGRSKLLAARANEIAARLADGFHVCLPDLRGTGESGLGTGRSRNSSATGLSSSLLMQGETLLAGQIRDLRGVLAWLRSRPDVDATRILLRGDSLAPANSADTDFRLPRDDDEALPRGSEPMGALVALLTALFDEQVAGVVAHGGLVSHRALFDSHLVLFPHDALIPGACETGDVAEIVAALAPRPVRLTGLVDGLNRSAVPESIAAEFAPALGNFALQRAGERLVFPDAEGGSAADWWRARRR